MDYEQKQLMEHEKSKDDLKKIRGLSLFLPFFHIIATAVLLIMGFSPAASENSEDHSVTIIFLAFIAMVTSLWAAVGSWETFSATRPVRTSVGIKFRLPPWEWHSDHFIKGIKICFVLTVCLWPSVMIFLVQSQGAEFLPVIFSGSPEISSILILHSVTSALVLMTELVSIWYTTKFLNAEQKKLEEQAHQSADFEDHITAIPKGLKIMAIISVVINSIWLGNLCNIAASKYIERNSGNITCAVTQSIATALILYYTWKVLLPSNSELDIVSWALNWRSVAILHLLLAWIITWVALEITVSLEQFGRDFGSGLNALNTTNFALVILLISIFVFYLVVYFFFLILHTRCMNTLDEIASQRLVGMLEDSMSDEGDDEDDSDEGDQEEKED